MQCNSKKNQNINGNRLRRIPCNLNFNTRYKFKSWLAGLLDGEGNFNYYVKKKSHPRIRIVLQERDKFVLDYIVSNLGGKLRYRKPTERWRPNTTPQWEWILDRIEDCEKFTEWIIPDLILKKRDAIDFLNELRSW